MATTIANEFLRACNRACRFLVTDHRFQPGILDIDWKIRFADVSYLGKNVAVEYVYDENEYRGDQGLSTKPLSEMFQAKLSNHAGLVRKYGPEVVRDFATLFDI